MQTLGKTVELNEYPCVLFFEFQSQSKQQSTLSQISFVGQSEKEWIIMNEKKKKFWEEGNDVYNV